MDGLFAVHSKLMAALDSLMWLATLMVPRVVS